MDLRENRKLASCITILNIFAVVPMEFPWAQWCHKDYSTFAWLFPRYIFVCLCPVILLCKERQVCEMLSHPKSPEYKQEWQLAVCVCVLVAQLCLTLCEPTDCSPPGSLDHGILPARILEWVAIPFSRVSSQSRDQTCVSCIAGRFFTIWATGEGWQLAIRRYTENFSLSVTT